MSERKAYRLNDGTYQRTQAEARASGQSFESVLIPVDSQGLVDFLNTLIAKERQGGHVLSPAPAIVPDFIKDDPTIGPDSVVYPKAPPPPAEPPADHAAMRRKLAQELRGMEVEAIEDRILDMKAAPLGRILAASVERFGLLGKDAWDSLHAFLKLHSAAANNYDRGLHLLSLHQIERLNEPKPEPKTYKELNA